MPFCKLFFKASLRPSCCMLVCLERIHDAWWMMTVNELTHFYAGASDVVSVGKTCRFWRNCWRIVMNSYLTRLWTIRKMFCIPSAATQQGLKYLKMSTTHREGRWSGRRPRARHGDAKRWSAEGVGSEEGRHKFWRYGGSSKIKSGIRSSPQTPPSGRIFNIAITPSNAYQCTKLQPPSSIMEEVPK